MLQAAGWRECRRRRRRRADPSSQGRLQGEDLRAAKEHMRAWCGTSQCCANEEKLLWTRPNRGSQIQKFDLRRLPRVQVCLASKHALNFRVQILPPTGKFSISQSFLLATSNKIRINWHQPVDIALQGHGPMVALLLEACPESSMACDRHGKTPPDCATGRWFWCRDTVWLDIP